MFQIPIPIPLRSNGRTRYTTGHYDEGEDDEQEYGPEIGEEEEEGEEYFEDAEDVREVFGNQSLPVAQLPDDFDGNPIDGEQYLAVVRREAAAQPSIFFAANNPYASTSSSSNAAAAIALGLANTSLAAQLASLGMPSEEWRGVFLQKFRTLRQHYSEPPTKKVPFIQDKMPKRNDERGWYIWIHGKVPPEEEEKLLAIERAQKLAKQEAAEAREDSDMDMEESGDETPASSKAVPREWKIKEPSGGSLRRLSTEQALDLLNQFPNWLSHKTNIPTPDASPAAVLQPLHARWLFALLAWLDDRLLSEQISVLRTVARACIAAISMCRMRRKALQSRKKKSTTEADAEAVEAQLAQEQPAELESSLPEADESGAWMVVTIVAGIWGQSDLWDDAMTDMKRIA